MLLLQAGGTFDPIEVVAGSGLVAKATLLILAVMSVVAWSIWGSRRLTLGRLCRESKAARESLVRASDPSTLTEQGRSLPEGPVRGIFLATIAEWQDVARAWSRGGGAPDEVRATAGRELLGRTIAGVRGREVLRARRGLAALATIGATAPFIGLFGTVWGIVDSFESIGMTGSADLSVVAPGVAEALVATAAGLVAAVPAVWFFNGLSQMVRRLASELDGFGIELMNAYDRAVASGTHGTPGTER